MVVAEVLAKDSAQVSLIQHDNLFQTVPSDGTDQAFDERIFPRRARCSDDFLDSQTLAPSLHRCTVGAISIPYQGIRANSPARYSTL